MGDIWTVQVSGGLELERKLKRLPDVVQKRVVKGAVKSAQSIVLRSVRSRTQNPSRRSARRKIASTSKQNKGSMAHRMAKNIKLYVRKKKRPGEYSMTVRFKTESEGLDQSLIYYPMGSYSSLKSRKTHGKRTFIPAAIEFGHGPGRRTQPLRFFTEGAKRVKGQAIKVFVNKMFAGIAREFRVG